VSVLANRSFVCIHAIEGHHPKSRLTNRSLSSAQLVSIQDSNGRLQKLTGTQVLGEVTCVRSAFGNGVRPKNTNEDIIMHCKRLCRNSHLKPSGV